MRGIICLLFFLQYSENLVQIRYKPPWGFTINLEDQWISWRVQHVTKEFHEKYGIDLEWKIFSINGTQIFDETFMEHKLFLQQNCSLPGRDSMIASSPSFSSIKNKKKKNDEEIGVMFQLIILASISESRMISIVSLCACVRGGGIANFFRKLSEDFTGFYFKIRFYFMKLSSSPWHQTFIVICSCTP